MVMDLAVELIHATVQLEQPLGDGTRTVGTGFLISAPGADGKPRTVLVTANHVLDKMPGQNARIAAIEIQAPAEFAKAAIPVNYLAKDETFDAYQVNAGNEMMALGFPRGLSANSAGFPILRSGRVASYPLGPAAAFPTFLLDFSVFPGNSGGPVFISRQQNPTGLTPVSDKAPDPGFIAGLLTQQVELNSERLEIGIVTHAKYIRETIDMLGAPLTPSIVTEIEPPPTVQGARTASAEEAAARN